VALEREAEALDGVGDEHARAIVGGGAVEGVEDRLQTVAAEFGHQGGERVVVVRGDEREGVGVGGEVGVQALAPSRAALIGQGGVEVVGRASIQAWQRRAAGLGEGRRAGGGTTSACRRPSRRPRRFAVAGEHRSAVVASGSGGVVDDHMCCGRRACRLVSGIVDVTLVELGVASSEIIRLPPGGMARGLAATVLRYWLATRVMATPTGA
jgi:hypothetical protein